MCRFKCNLHRYIEQRAKAAEEDAVGLCTLNSVDP
jgi:hypothetical protein